MSCFVLTPSINSQRHQQERQKQGSSAKHFEETKINVRCCDEEYFRDVGGWMKGEILLCFFSLGQGEATVASWCVRGDKESKLTDIRGTLFSHWDSS